MKRGDVFRHGRLLDPSWRPGPYERYADAPKAVCRVTKTTRVAGGTIVYYGIGADAHTATQRILEAKLLADGAEVLTAD